MYTRRRANVITVWANCSLSCARVSQSLPFQPPLGVHRKPNTSHALVSRFPVHSPMKLWTQDEQKLLLAYVWMIEWNMFESRPGLFFRLFAGKCGAERFVNHKCICAHVVCAAKWQDLAMLRSCSRIPFASYYHTLYSTYAYSHPLYSSNSCICAKTFRIRRLLWLNMANSVNILRCEDWKTI